MRESSSDFLSGCSLSSFLASLLREKEFADAGFEASLRNLDRCHQLGQLLVVPDCKTDVLGLDRRLLCLFGLVASDFEYFSDQILDASGHEDACAAAHAFTVATSAQKTGAASRSEDEASFCLTRDPFSPGSLSDFGGGGLS